MKVYPLTALLKCPHERGQIIDERKRAGTVSPHAFGDEWQAGQALQELDIRSIFAHNPQAKGRVERLFRVLQDRLMAELVLKGIQNIPSAIEFLRREFMDHYIHSFGVEAQESESAWCKLSPKIDFDMVISFRYQAVMGNDNAIRLGGIIIDIPEGPRQRGYAKTVDVRQFLDGS